MKRPMLWFVLFFVLGILLGQYAVEGIVFFSAASVLIGLFMYYYNKYVLIAAICLVLGYVNVLWLQNDYTYDSEIAEISGYVIEATETEWGSKLVIETETIKTDNLIVTENMRIWVYLRSTEFSEPGREMIIRGVLAAPQEERLSYFRKNKIMYSVYGNVLETGGIRNTPIVMIKRLQARLAQVYDYVLPKKQAAVAKAMIIGDKSELSDEIRNIYNISGIIHILSISGLHVAILALTFNRAVSKLPLNGATTGTATIIFLLFYCLLTGASVATVRATIMCIVVILGDILGRDNDTLSSLSFAALVLLIYEPYFLWDAGFQYSFTVAAALNICTEPMERAITRLSCKVSFLNPFLTQQYVHKYLSSCVVASLASYPITAWHFYRIPLYSIITNLLIAGSVFITVLSGFTTGAIGLVSKTAGTFCAGGLYTLLWLYEQLCQFISELPYADLQTGRPSIIFVFCFYFGLLMFAFYFRRRVIE